MIFITCPSHPPLTKSLPCVVIAIAETPLLWALNIEYINLPVIGVNALMTPSFQAVNILLPSEENVTSEQLKLVTTMRSNSCMLRSDQTRTSSLLAVAKTCEKLLGFNILTIMQTIVNYIKILTLENSHNKLERCDMSLLISGRKFAYQFGRFRMP